MFVEEIIRLYNEYGRINISIWNEYSKYKEHNFNWFRHKYGGIKNLLKENGIEYLYYNEYTKEQIIENAKTLYEKYGYIDKMLCGKNKICSSSVRKYFGNYNNLFLEINAEINMPRNVKEIEVVNDVKTFIENTGCLSSICYRKYGKYSCSLINKYGGWEKIINNLGYVSTRNSQAEVLIQNYLEKSNIQFDIHHSFDWLISNDGYKMYVDFYLIDYNVVIEYDGEQHYKFVEYFHKTIEGFEKAKARDELKEELLKQHNIIVYRIIYSDDILYKLSEILNSLN